MSSNQSQRGAKRRRPGSRRAEGDKRRDILDAATRRFGADGYEHTKWADIAADVGVGPTALYHYFESKQHCLFVIMDQALVDLGGRLRDLTAANRDPLGALGPGPPDRFHLPPPQAPRHPPL